MIHFNTKYGSKDKALKQPDGLAVLGVLLNMSANPNTEHVHFRKIINQFEEFIKAESSTNLTTPFCSS